MPELSDARLDGRKGACPLVRTTPAAVSRCMERGVVALLFGSAAGSGFAGRGSALLLLDGGGPAAEEVERFVRFGAGLRCESQEVQAGIGGELHHLEGEGEIADDGVVEALGAGLVQTHVVGRPAGAELLAARGELADEVGQVAVVRVAAGLGS